MMNRDDDDELVRASLDFVKVLRDTTTTALAGFAAQLFTPNDTFTRSFPRIARVFGADLVRPMINAERDRRALANNYAENMACANFDRVLDDYGLRSKLAAMTFEMLKNAQAVPSTSTVLAPLVEAFGDVVALAVYLEVERRASVVEYVARSPTFRADAAKRVLEAMRGGQPGANVIGVTTRGTPVHGPRASSSEVVGVALASAKKGDRVEVMSGGALMVIGADPGDRIDAFAARLVKNAPVIGRFNDIDIVVAKTDTIDMVVTRYNEARDAYVERANQRAREIVKKPIGDGAEIERALGAPKEKGCTVTVPCEKCKHPTVYPLGEPSMRQLVCPHVFDFDNARGVRGLYVCRGCEITISPDDVERAADGTLHYSKRANALADKLTAMQDDLTRTLAENATLRREIDALERRSTKR